MTQIPITILVDADKLTKHLEVTSQEVTLSQITALTEAYLDGASANVRKTMRKAVLEAIQRNGMAQVKAYAVGVVNHVRFYASVHSNELYCLFADVGVMYGSTNSAVDSRKVLTEATWTLQYDQHGTPYARQLRIATLDQVREILLSRRTDRGYDLHALVDKVRDAFVQAANLENKKLKSVLQQNR